MKLLLSLLLCYSAAAIGSLFTLSSIPNWYRTLEKPFFTPPNWLFGPVWTILYTLTGVSFFLVWKATEKGREKENAIKIFLLQLGLNVLWSIVFFGFRQPAGGVAIIIGLWISIHLTILQFRKLSVSAAGLLVPYIVWVSYASLLNFFIFFLN
jgi:tryptophan-rich sensory protein